MANYHRVTIRDVAKAVGLSKSTVSLALRNDPRLRKATREKIRAVAAQLGYRPDPALAALAHYRYGNASPGAPVLGWLTNWPERDEWRNDSRLHHFNGACRQAERMGYQLEHFWLREPGLSWSRRERIFLTRNIRGLLIAPQPIPHPPLNLTWSNYAAVAIGYSLKAPRLHTVSSFHFRSMKIALRELRKRGYRKIGFATSGAVDTRNESSLRAAFLLDWERNRADPIPPLICINCSKRSFLGWFQQYRPEAVITADSELTAAIREWWSELGLSVPDDVGLVAMSAVPLDGDLTGIHEHREKIGATAVNLIGSMLHHNNLGLPDVPMCIQIDGCWVDGKTVRPLPPSRNDMDKKTFHEEGALENSPHS